MKSDNKFGFSSSLTTSIFLEEASEANPFVCEKRYLSGYDNIDLAKKKGFIDTLLLLFNLELPSSEDAMLLEMLMVGLITLGNRHPAVRASMSAGISKANPEHILPIGLIVGGGMNGGAAQIKSAYEFIFDNQGVSPDTLIDMEHQRKLAFSGFGSSYGEIDPYIRSLSQAMKQRFPSARHLKWCVELAELLAPDNQGLLDVGLAAAVFCDLNVGAREGIGLFQLVSAPGLIAQGMEQTHKPITSMPLLEDENYDFRK